LLKNTYRRHSKRSEVRFCIARLLCDASLFGQNAKKREIPHFADFVRNDEFGVFSASCWAPERPEAASRIVEDTLGLLH
jgi:hypothetical protein